MFKKIFGKSEDIAKNIEIKAPISGQYVAIESIPDPVFAQKMMGEGFGIEPTEGVVVAPIDGEIVNVFPTKHAIGIKAANGLELLIHVGLETVAMKGEGFDTKVTTGDKVKVGDELLTFDIEHINKNASSIISPVIITNSDVIENLTISNDGLLSRGESTVLNVDVK
ncbi:PTS sugar transporter subunit IIA [Macrococcoides caseolyticum]|uniref:PTS sugar transporter subunit IIA n=1 Tax=Macrococcoides caseolyticum TaxID=69966 RepID=UPI001F1E689D|nr:PTS glucose transporter subunit IIA [Macrococcus caseolyticus]MCE4957018.1 PTS glucose transporter subunit IIA [Macrococcus caseolyticus]